MAEDNYCKILEAGTIVCLRHENGEWQVLLGQSQVKNWLKSTKDDCVLMRYAGEWKLPGGVKDSIDATIRDTALRELCEEFIGVEINQDPILHPSGIKMTRPVRGKRYRVHNFVAYAHECSTWLNQDTERIINENLRARIDHFKYLVENDMYYSQSLQEKERVSPELYRVAWISLPKAIQMLSTADAVPFTPVDEWQETEFLKYNLTQRDSMYQTMRLLQELQLPSDSIQTSSVIPVNTNVK